MLALYKNIKKRRLELNISQQELAEAVGYKGKSMISQVENGLVDLPESMIMKFADALDCTESYLMGWTETNDPQQNDRVMAYAKTILRNKILKEYMDKISELPEEYQNLALTSIDRIYEAYKLTEDIK